MKRKGVKLNHRDRELFNYLYEVKVATASQITRDIYKGLTKTVVYRRLKKLIGQQYLVRTHYFDKTRAISVYSLSKSSLRRFVLGRDDKYKIKRCLSDSIEHDVILNDIRHLFLSLQEVDDYLSENILHSDASFVTTEELQPFKNVSPDGVILLRKKGKVFHIAIEYEHTLKYSSRYRSLFFRYYLESDIPHVFYICRDKKILQRVSRVEKGSVERGREKVLFTTLDDLFSNPKYLKLALPNDQREIHIS